jgi:hypothetical protein
MIAIDVDSGSGLRRVDLLAYLEPVQEERAQQDAYAWIKAMRHLQVDGAPFRTRFTLRGDSLWWFAELFLHKEQAMLNTCRAIAAFDTLVEHERPQMVRTEAHRFSGVIAQAAAARHVRYEGPGWVQRARDARVRMDARAAGLAMAARLSRIRPASAPPSTARVAAFVHRAFWNSDVGDGTAESYIGPVLREVESRVGRASVAYVGVGPRRNFRARRWWHAVLPREEQGMVPIERYAPPRALEASRAVFAERHRVRRLLWQSEELRAHAVIRGCDCWPLVREQLAGIALLQFPWSARAMDEAAAALDAVQPSVALTYAEAGGWGRALALECRRARVPLVALQHGFIYRHWLNYRHEPDEAAADPRNPADAGFPFPAATLLFDDRTSDYLASAGHFPADRLRVTGSARLDDLHETIAGLSAADLERTRRACGAGDDRTLVLFAAKEREARRWLPALMTAVGALSSIQLAIKPHPAETPEVYAAIAAGLDNVRVLGADAPLPALLAAARAIVTVNSTVAIDALTLGVPSVVIGLPNNLTPFVEAGLMAGGNSAGEIREAIEKVLYNQEFRRRIEGRRAAGAPGRAAARSAEAIVGLVGAM